MQISSLSGTTTTRRVDVDVEVGEVVELHWMAEPDVSLGAAHGLSVPALCGVWMEADESLAAQVTSGEGPARVVSCPACDLLRALL